jgi:hypothetical protein
VKAPARRLACACLAASAVSCAACCAGSVPPSAPLASLGRPASFSVPDEDGDLRCVPDRAARATVVELWSAGCEPCKAALPALAGEAAGLEREGVALVLLSVLDGGEPIGRPRAALRAWGVERGFLVDRGGGVERTLGVDRLPATIVLDREGVVRWVAPPGAPASEVALAARRVADAHR